MIMGKQFHTVTILALCTITLLVGAGAWYIGLEQSYQQKQDSLKSVIQLLSTVNNTITTEQQSELAHQQGITLYRILRDEYELISIEPKDSNLNKTLILQSLKQQDGFIPTSLNPENTLFYKQQINRSVVLLASTPLSDVKQTYILATKSKMLILLALVLTLYSILLIWRFKKQFNTRKKKVLSDKQKQALGIYLK
ncbi:MAG: hypothetical protein ACI910_000920, partial [Oleispira sp.]